MLCTTEKCKNYDAKCGASAGWPATFCSSHAHVYDLCPVLCGKCGQLL